MVRGRLSGVRATRFFASNSDGMQFVVARRT